MKKFVKLLRREGGFTLVELIVALSLFTVAAGIISGITMLGLRSYHKISIENSLRDEGDLLMSAIITELYTFAPDKVTPTIKLNDEKTEIVDSYITLERQDGTKSRIRIAKDILTIAPPDVIDPPADTRTKITSRLAQGSAITLECQNAVPCESGLISIDLSLVQSYDGRDFPLELKSKFGF
ncbi:MAG TPA: prepilin-type N-terminal cleavage/methylation domain-containing protein [Paenibacillus sp.]|jgi:prepilin-type N-terminal cleavage/methylation domain-containing protein